MRIVDELGIEVKRRRAAEQNATSLESQLAKVSEAAKLMREAIQRERAELQQKLEVAENRAKKYYGLYMAADAFITEKKLNNVALERPNSGE